VYLNLSDGPHQVEADYSAPSDPSTVTSSFQGTVFVGQAPTQLTVTPPQKAPGSAGSSSTLFDLAATLTSSGKPIVGAPVWFSAQLTELCNATTDASGTASCEYDAGATDQFGVVGNGVDATFGGDPAFQPVTAHSSDAQTGGDGHGGDDDHGATATAGSDGSGPVTSPSDDSSSTTTPGDGLSADGGGATSTTQAPSLGDAVDAGRTSPASSGNWLVALVSLGVLLVAGATFVRRRARARALFRAGGSGPLNVAQRPGPT